jgi:hypothetical protein
LNQAVAELPRSIPALRVGDLVEVLSAREILATLDERGELENLPFMPEMLQFCGRRMTVHKVAHKLCEVITGGGGLRWLNNAVHLKGARCDGGAHGGCQTACSLYWKEAWLRRVSNAAEVASPPPADADTTVLFRAAKKDPDVGGADVYSCQATEILRAAPSRIRTWELDQYVADLKSGNASLYEVTRTLLYQLFNAYQRWSQRVLPSWLLIKEGLAWGFVKGCDVKTTPTGHLDLRPGELVRIKSKDEIMRTLDARRLNRGMGFEEEMARSCGQTVRVGRRVDRCIEEKSGKLVTMKNPCIILEGVVCRGVYHGNCPREYVPFWREVWLERVNSAPQQATEDVEPRA